MASARISASWGSVTPSALAILGTAPIRAEFEKLPQSYRVNRGRSGNL